MRSTTYRSAPAAVSARSNRGRRALLLANAAEESLRTGRLVRVDPA